MFQKALILYKNNIQQNSKGAQRFIAKRQALILYKNNIQPFEIIYTLLIGEALVLILYKNNIQHNMDKFISLLNKLR